MILVTGYGGAAPSQQDRDHSGGQGVLGERRVQNKLVPPTKKKNQHPPKPQPKPPTPQKTNPPPQTEGRGSGSGPRSNIQFKRKRPIDSACANHASGTERPKRGAEGPRTIYKYSRNKEHRERVSLRGVGPKGILKNGLVAQQGKRGKRRLNETF